MVKVKRKLGIMGGTFDPIHNGHLRSAMAIQERLNLNQVVFIPACIPPHKQGQHFAPPEARLEMTRLATKDYPGFTYSDIELKRTGVSYTIDTILELKKQYPKHELCFIVGEDTVLQLHTWYRVQELLELVTFVAAERPGYVHVIEKAAEKLGPKARERIVLINTPEYDVSSTEIRARVRAGKDLNDLVPDAVAKYIKEHGLYKE